MVSGSGRLGDLLPLGNAVSVRGRKVIQENRPAARPSGDGKSASARLINVDVWQDEAICRSNA